MVIGLTSLTIKPAFNLDLHHSIAWRMTLITGSSTSGFTSPYISLHNLCEIMACLQAVCLSHCWFFSAPSPFVVSTVRVIWPCSRTKAVVDDFYKCLAKQTSQDSQRFPNLKSCRSILKSSDLNLFQPVWQGLVVTKVDATTSLWIVAVLSKLKR